MTDNNRIDVRDRVRRLQKEPREECRLEIERLRKSLTTDLIHLQSLQSTLNYTGFNIWSYVFEELPHELSDDSGGEDIEEADCTRDAHDPEDALPPELIPLHLPSSHSSTPHHPLRRAELHLRIKQAARYLAALRDAIAQKSFQYSHVMRSAPSKGVRTRSRSTIHNISDQISQYFKVYCRARASMVRLGADENTLDTFRLLSRDDVKASTAILDPNIPGSSSIRLSWIWQTGSRASRSTPEAMLECA